MSLCQQRGTWGAVNVNDGLHSLLATSPCLVMCRLQDLHSRLAHLSMQEGREAFNEEVSQLQQREHEEEERIQTARTKGEVGQLSISSPVQYCSLFSSELS